MAKKKKCPQCPSLPKWQTTFSDMNSLLLTFFVLLLSMATFEKIKLVEAFGIFSGSRGIFDTRSSDDTKIEQQMTLVSRQTSSPTSQTRDNAVQSLESYIEAQNLQQMVSVIKTNRGFTVRVIDSVLFRSGSYDILPASYPIMDRIASVGADSPFYINIEGHTDDQPTGQFAISNWDLSSNRALAVLKYMIRDGVDPHKLSASGFGEYHPLLPNITAENRAMNRRVEINFISPEFYESGKNIFDSAE